MRFAVEYWGVSFGWLDPVRIRAVAVLKYGTDKSFQVDEISPGNAVLELLNNTVSARSAPELAMQCLSRSVPGARCWKGTRGEAAEAATHLLELTS